MTSMGNCFKIDDKRNIDDRIFAFVFTPLASCKTKFRVCNLGISNLAELASNGNVMGSFSGLVRYFAVHFESTCGLSFGITAENYFSILYKETRCDVPGEVRQGI
jgi:hypothetical protein